MAYAASDYMQDGLILMLDGIENAGALSHDPTATVWKDLSGHGNDVPVYYPEWWREKCVYCDGSDRFGLLESFISTNRLTIDCCFKIDDGYDQGAAVCHILRGRDREDPRRMVAARLDDDQMLVKITNVDNSFSYETTNERQSVCTYVHEANQESSEDAFYVNGLPVTGVSTAWGYGWSDWTVGLSVGGGAEFDGFVDWPFKGEINCIRIYDRKLEQSEAEYNHQIDLARFATVVTRCTTTYAGLPIDDTGIAAIATAKLRDQMRMRLSESLF